MGTDLKYIEVMRAEQAPDVYAGPNCDGMRADWRTNELGSKEPDTGGMDTLTLAAEHFPAGTKISISVPVCPNCGDDAQSADGTKCQCGFDWEEWARDKYS